jgi:hypothetical protein
VQILARPETLESAMMTLFHRLRAVLAMATDRPELPHLLREPPIAISNLIVPRPISQSPIREPMPNQILSQ